MIFGLNAFHFILLILCSLVSGALGALLVLFFSKTASRRARKKDDKQAINHHIAHRRRSSQSASEWQRTVRDEQIYNGR